MLSTDDEPSIFFTLMTLSSFLKVSVPQGSPPVDVYGLLLSPIPSSIHSLANQQAAHFPSKFYTNCLEASLETSCFPLS